MSSGTTGWASVAIGGGSTIGLAKAIAFERRLPILAVATTYSGSEVTPIWGYTENGIKHVAKDAHTQPRTVIYDPLLTLKLPPKVSGTSGVNAIAHCVEALYSETANPLVQFDKLIGADLAIVEGAESVLHADVVEDLRRGSCLGIAAVNVGLVILQ